MKKKDYENKSVTVCSPDGRELTIELTTPECLTLFEGQYCLVLRGYSLADIGRAILALQVSNK